MIFWLAVASVAIAAFGAGWFLGRRTAEEDADRWAVVARRLRDENNALVQRVWELEDAVMDGTDKELNDER